MQIRGQHHDRSKQLGLENPFHLAIILVVVLLVFGAKRLPEMGRSLGAGLRGFKESVSSETPAKPQLETANAPVKPQLETANTPAKPQLETANAAVRHTHDVAS
jgi:sec-independent protein translocase protein TatA